MSTIYTKAWWKEIENDLGENAGVYGSTAIVYSQMELKEAVTRGIYDVEKVHAE